MERVGQFRIVSKIGSGGMGTVYRARDERLDRDVALKVVSDGKFADEKARARLFREARAAAALSHPNICVVHDVGEQDGQTYIAMECVEGETLAARILRGMLTPAEVVRFGAQLAEALAHAHERGVVHRDLKPANIIITPEQRLKVLDFGLARRSLVSSDPGAATDAVITTEGLIVGTPAYMSPEQLCGSTADERSDIWAVGAILHEMTSGRRPFSGDTWPKVTTAILVSEPEPLPSGTPGELAAIIRRCLEKEPASRYRTAAEVRAALEAIQFGPEFVRVARGPSESVRAGDAIAVLPFWDFSGEGEEYFAEGMHDAVIGELARIKELRVLSRSSTLAFRRSELSATEIAKRLGAGSLVEGSVTHSGERVRVQLKLIRTVPEERQVWAEAYDRSVKDIFALYAEIARAVALQVNPGVALPANLASADANRSVDPELYKIYLRGMYQLHKGEAAGFAKAITLLREGIEKDPTDGLMYSGLSFAYMLRVHDGLGTPDDLQLARAAATTALSLSPSSAQAHAAKAVAMLLESREPDAVEDAFRRAVELNPTLSLVRRLYAWFLMVRKRDDEAIAEMRAARDRDPLVGILYADLGWLLQMVGRFDEALVETRMGVELAPEHPNVLYNHGIVCQKLRRLDDAIAIHRRMASIAPLWDWGLAHSLVLAGRRDEAEPIIESLKNRSDMFAAFGLAEIYVALGDKEEALRWVYVARERRMVWVPWFGVFAELQPLRGDARFDAVLEGLGVPVVEPEWGQPAVPLLETAPVA